MKKLSEETIKEIIDLYKRGIPPLQIGQKYGIMNNSVTRILRKRGIERNQHDERVSDENIKIIIDRYLEGKSSEIIADELNIDGSTVCRILKRNNIEIRPGEINKRHYKVNLDYFENIDTEEKAYFLGFLYADGSLSSKGNDVRIVLHPKDIDILERFSKIIYGTVKLEETAPDEAGRIYKRFCVTAKKLHDDLTKWGCTPNKTFTIRFPKNLLSDDLLRHFIRGYFDGDGCISIANTLRPVIDFSSNIVFIQELKAYLESKDFICNKIGINKENELSGNVQMTGLTNIARMYYFMYDGASIYMNRKYNIFQEFLKLEKDRPQIINYGNNYVPKLNGERLIKENIIANNNKDDLAIYIRDFYRKNGFPYPKLSDDGLIKAFSEIKNKDVSFICENKILNTRYLTGNDIAKHFSTHFWEVKSGYDPDRQSIKEAFNDDEALLSAVKYLIKQEKDVNGISIKASLEDIGAFKTSTFSTMIAKYIYQTFTKEGDIIYDYSSGFGQRLTAALSLPYYVKYIGVDVCEKSIISNQELFNFFNKNIPLLNKRVSLTLEGSENFCPEELVGKVNLAFSSPPYFKLEKYEDNFKQAVERTYIDFINNYWRDTVKNINRMLVPDGYFLLNIIKRCLGFDIAENMTNIMKEQGLRLVDTYYMCMNKNNYKTSEEDPNKNQENKYEPIYVFRK